MAVLLTNETARKMLKSINLAEGRNVARLGYTPQDLEEDIILDGDLADGVIDYPIRTLETRPDSVGEKQMVNAERGSLVAAQDWLDRWGIP